MKPDETLAVDGAWRMKAAKGPWGCFLQLPTCHLWCVHLNTDWSGIKGLTETVAYSLCLHYSTACYNSLFPDLALWGEQETPEGCWGPVAGLRRGRQRDRGDGDERWHRRGVDPGEEEKSTKPGLNGIKRRTEKTEGWGSGERWHRAQVDEEHYCLLPGATDQKLLKKDI